MKINIKGKRLAAIDYGKRRIGVAVCDIFHIAITPITTIDRNDKNSFDKLVTLLTNEKAEALVVGIPIKHDGSESEIAGEIKEFAELLHKSTDLNVYFQDEAYSSKNAVRTMLEIGTKKKNRRRKGNTDRFAAAIILREFLNENEN